jgi:hypothetical protein
MTVAGRRAIIEATKKRWAEFRKKAAKPAVARKAARKKVAAKSPAKVAKKAVKKTTAKRPKPAVAAPEQATPTVAAGE